MKLQIKQLDTVTTNTVAVALEMYADYIAQVDDDCSNKYRELSVMFRHSIPLLISELYDSPVDDVQVLGNHRGVQ